MQIDCSLRSDLVKILIFCREFRQIDEERDKIIYIFFLNLLKGPVQKIISFVENWEKKNRISFSFSNNRDWGYLEFKAVSSIKCLIDIRNFLSQRRKGNIQRFGKMLIGKGAVQKEKCF